MATLEQLVHAFAKKYPTPASHPNGGDTSWDQDCGAAMSRLCLAYGKEPTGDVHSAFHVYTRSKIVSTDYRKAIPGDFHFWDIAGPGNGHTSLEWHGGGEDTFMGNWRAHAIEGAVGLGFLSVPDYTRLSGARYLGFSRQYADGDVTQFTLPAPASVPAANTSGLILAHGTDWSYAQPSTVALRKRVQAAMKERNNKFGGPPRYEGPVDGDWGIFTIKGIQITLNLANRFDRNRNDGKVDGVMGRGDCYGVQQYAHDFGEYSYKIDGAPRDNSWANFALGLERK